MENDLSVTDFVADSSPERGAQADALSVLLLGSPLRGAVTRSVTERSFPYPFNLLFIAANLNRFI